MCSYLYQFKTHHAKLWQSNVIQVSRRFNFKILNTLFYSEMVSGGSVFGIFNFADITVSSHI